MTACMAGSIRGLDAENYEALAARLTHHAAKLLKKPDQCRAILLCSHLFWSPQAVRTAEGRSSAVGRRGGGGSAGTRRRLEWRVCDSGPQRKQESVGVFAKVS